MNLPTINLRRGGRRGKSDTAAPANDVRDGLGVDDHMERSRLAQKQADKWLISWRSPICTPSTARSSPNDAPQTGFGRWSR
jgi:hypothetical protein